MKTIQAIPGRVLALGRLGENEYTQILLPVPEDWDTDYPAGEHRGIP